MLFAIVRGQVASLTSGHQKALQGQDSKAVVISDEPRWSDGCLQLSVRVC